MASHHETIREIELSSAGRDFRQFDYSARVMQDTGGPALELTIHFKDVSAEPFCYWFSTRNFSDSDVDWLASVLLNVLEALTLKTHKDVMDNINGIKNAFERVMETGHRPNI